MFVRQFAKWLFPSIMLKGYSKTINSQAVTVLKEDANERPLLVRFDSAAITDGGAGYAGGCTHLKDNGNNTTSIYYNEGDHTSCDFNLIETVAAVISAVVADYGLVGGGTAGSVTLSRGLSVRNESGSTIVKGSLVRVSGYANGMPLIVLADANASGGQARYVLSADLTNNTNGTAYGVQLVTNINTDAAAAVGDPLYLSETAGAFTPTAPVNSDAFTQRVGIVVTKHATTGSALFFPELGVMDVVGRNEIRNGSITPSKMSSWQSLTATADGTGSGASNADATHFEVTSASATNQISLPGINNTSRPLTYYVGANGFELITPAASNATINGTDADGTNQADIPANSMVRVTPVSNTAWIMEIIGSTGTVAAPVIPDND